MPGRIVPPTNNVDDAFNGPDTCNPAPMEEEAELRKPPVNVARLFTKRVDEAFSGPATWRPAPIEEEAEEIKPTLCVVSPNILVVPDTLTLPEESTKKSPRFAVDPWESMS